MPRQKKQKMRSNDGDAVVDQTAAASSSSRWSGIPEFILDRILTLLRPRIVDVLAFRRVCRSWRLAARESLPPLLLPGSPRDPASITFHSTLEPGLHRSKRLPGLHEFCIAFSHGHFIMMDFPDYSKPTVINPVSGATIHFPRAPIHVSGAIMSAPPSSSDCWLMGWGFGMRPFCPAFVFWQPGSTACTVQWLHHQHQIVGDVIPLGNNRFVIVWPVFGCMTVARLALDPDLLHPLLMELGLTPPLPLELKHGLEQCLVAVVLLGGELWVLDFPRLVKDGNQHMWLKACRLDSARGKSTWVEEPFGLAGKVLVVRNKGCIVLDDPGNWGFEGNCIYFKEADHGAWMRFSLEDMKVAEDSRC